MQDCSEILRNLDHLSALNRGGTCAPIDLHAVIKDYLDSFVAVNGDEFWVPKCHITLHLNEFLRHHGTLLSCFAHDRKQRFVKRFGNPVNNVIQSFEKSILSDIIHAQVREFGEEAVGLGLSLFKDKKVAKGKVDWRSDMLGSSDCFTSIRAQGPGGHLVQKDDVVEYLEGDGPPSVGQVMYHVRHGSTLLNVLCPWDRVRDTMFKVKHDPAVILLSYVVPWICHVPAHEHYWPSKRDLNNMAVSNHSCIFQHGISKLIGGNKMYTQRNFSAMRPPFV